MSNLKVFDQLVSDITKFVAPIKFLAVKDPESSQQGIVAAQTIKKYLNAVEDKRKELVGPLNEQVKAINAYCKDITAPLTNADAYVRTQLNEFAAEQEKIRRAEEQRIESERREAERMLALERQKTEDELRAKLEAESEAKAKSASMFGSDDGDIEKVNAEIIAAQDAEWAKKQEELAVKEATRLNEFKARQFDARQMNIKNTRAVLKVRVLDLNAIPKEFLIITPNEKALVAAGKAGVKIPGVEFYEDISVAIGRTTRMPGQ